MMILEEHLDPDEILRDVGDRVNDADTSERVRELDFRTIHDHNENYKEIAGDLDNL